MEIKFLLMRASFLVAICGAILSACVAENEVKHIENGEVMNERDGSKECGPDGGTILVVNYADNTKKIQPVSDFPASIQFKNVKKIVDGKEVVERVPVCEIRIRPLDKDGKLVEASKSSILSIQYLDGNGLVLESATMQK